MCRALQLPADKSEYTRMHTLLYSNDVQSSMKSMVLSGGACKPASRVQLLAASKMRRGDRAGGRVCCALQCSLVVGTCLWEEPSSSMGLSWWPRLLLSVLQHKPAGGGTTAKCSHLLLSKTSATGNHTHALASCAGAQIPWQGYVAGHAGVRVQTQTSSGACATSLAGQLP